MAGDHSENHHLDRSLTDLLKEAELSLKPLVDEDFLQRNDYLRKRFNDQQILEVFRLCLMRPAGHHWSPVYQVLLLLFQAACSDSYQISKEHFGKVGNYLLHRVRAGSRPVIYSFGVGNDVTFDTEAADLFEVPVYMFDPTPAVADFMKQYEGDQRLVFKNQGIFSRDAELKLYTSDKVLNSSLYPIHGKEKHEIVRCRTLDGFMAENGHDRVDILKMDVEGVADDVLEQIMDETQIRPLQIVTEFEIKGIENPLTYLPRLPAVVQKLKDNGYMIFNQLLTRKATIELIIVHRSLYEEFDAGDPSGYLPQA
ncbi:FkbM family methyltransferase [Sphingomonas piscis]|uniref:FkbM family methyltransferase n=1 Tax=Sphingomonas piscis TaxID=2714943 RepID=A0A6G7YMV5_9SPHN|nr:FkbM family methyltransferase [Sphingomonas piscis]QIK78074.1 FkbM family methyltransferase [Sphingomonas piscis]